jgi:hypothetical protein
MKWLDPAEQALLRVLNRGPGMFTKNDLEPMRSLVKRGLLTEKRARCPNCGLHDVLSTSLTERGKIACMILDVLARSPPSLLT